MKVLKSLKKKTRNHKQSTACENVFKVSVFLLNYNGQKIVTLEDTDGFQH